MVYIFHQNLHPSQEKCSNQKWSNWCQNGSLHDSTLFNLSNNSNIIQYKATSYLIFFFLLRFKATPVINSLFFIKDCFQSLCLFSMWNLHYVHIWSYFNPYNTVRNDSRVFYVSVVYFWTSCVFFVVVKCPVMYSLFLCLKWFAYRIVDWVLPLKSSL